MVCVLVSCVKNIDVNGKKTQADTGQGTGVLLFNSSPWHVFFKEIWWCTKKFYSLFGGHPSSNAEV